MTAMATGLLLLRVVVGLELVGHGVTAAIVTLLLRRRHPAQPATPAVDERLGEVA